METITGTTGNDILNGTSNSDVINGLPGSDTINPGLGSNDYVNAGTGNDLLVLNYSVGDVGTGVTMGVFNYSYGDEYSTYGSARRNISNTNSNVLDYVYWDRVERFQVTGTSKNDVLAGWIFNDILKGGSGNDVIYASQGGGTMDGGPGTDTLSADLSNVKSNIALNLATPVTLNLAFNSGSSTTLAISNFESLGRNGIGDFRTGSGNDSITGLGRNNDRIFTGGGNDTINPGVGVDDYVNGEEGLDTLALNYSQLDSGMGVTMGVFNYTYDSGLSTYGSARRNISSTNSDALDYIYWDEIEQFNVTGTSKDDVLAGWNYTDTLLGGSGNDMIHAGMGGGVFDGAGGIDVLGANLANSRTGVVINLSSAANLSLNLGGTTQSLKISNFESLGRNGVNDFRTGLGNDTLTGIGRNNDRIFTNGGNDVINPGLGSDDYVHGGVGQDQLILNFANLDSGTGVTMGTHAYNYGWETSTYGSARRNLNTSSGTALDYIYWDAIERFHVTGTSKADVLAGWLYNDTLNGGGGNDIIHANGGGGSFNGGDGVDVLGVALQNVTSNISLNLAQAKTQTLTFSDGTTDSLYVANFESFGRNGVNDFATGIGDDTLTAIGRNNDRIFLSEGDDVINPGLGSDDYVNGGAGQDLMILNYSTLDSGTGVVMNASRYDYGGEVSSYGSARRNVSTSNSNALDYIYWDEIDRFQVTGSSKNDSLGGWDNADLFRGGGGSDSIWGGGGNDTLYGEASVDYLYGGLGDDTLDGGVDNDILYGERGNDTLLSGDGNDKLYGGLGNDRLTGGGGNDRFAFDRPNEGVDTIVDFVKGVDKIQILASDFGSGLAAGTLASSRFILGSSATTDSQRFIFNSSSGALFFDPDGARSLPQIQIATLSSVGGVVPVLGNTDIVVV